MKKTLIAGVTALSVLSTSAVRADDLDWNRLHAATAALYGECNLDLRIHEDSSCQHLDTRVSCSKDGRSTYSDDYILRFNGLNNPRYHHSQQRVCPRAPNIDGVERLDRAAFMVYVRCVETEKNPRGLIFRLEGYTLSIYNNENF
jgi:hypothetical protein